MSFGGLILTNAGRNELIKAEMGERMNITHIVLGEGVYNGSYTAINNLVEEVMRIPVTSISRTDEGILVECDFNSLDAPRAFYLREIGIIANGVLCYYDNSRDDEEYIDPTSETLIKQKRMRFLLLISAEVEVNVGIVSSLYALVTDIPTKTSQLTNDSGYKTTDTNTTYMLNKSGNSIILVGSDGSVTSVTDNDTNTTYNEATPRASGLMSAADKSKLDGIAMSADTVSFTRNLSSGTKIGTITINGTSIDLYCQTNTDTTYTAGTGLSLSGTTFSNAGVRNVSTGTSNGTISVNLNGTVSNVPVKGLGSAAYTNSREYAKASHTHNYLPLSGGILTGDLGLQGKNIYPMTANQGFVGTTSNYFNAGVFQRIFTDVIAILGDNGNTAISICSKILQARNSDNSAWVPCYASAFTQQSSLRYKEHIIDLPAEKIDQIMQYRVVNYDYINTADGVDCMGMIAEEVAKINDYPVVYDSEGLPDGLDYSKFVPQLVAFCQKLQRKIEELEARIDKLEQCITTE